jgi:hypothetical protein
MKRLLAVVFALSAFGAVRPADAVDCSPMAPPTELALAMVVNGDTDQYVQVSWKKTADVNLTAFERYVLERRDDTAGGAFESVYDLLTFQTQQGFKNYVDTPPTGPPQGFCVGVCVKPGHSYTYRMATQFHYSSFSCDHFDDGASKVSAYSSEASVTVPGVDPTAPSDLVAVAETKKPKVRLSWKGAPTKPDQYVIKRRTTTPPTSGPKDGVLDFLEIGRVNGGVLAYVDATAASDEEYEYAVAASIAAGVGGQSQPDQAYTVGKCPPASIDVWDGTWTTSSDEGKTGELELTLPIVGYQQDAGNGAGSSSALVSFARDRWKTKVEGNTGAVDELWGSGTLSVQLTPHGPFDARAFQEMTGVLLFKSAKKRVSFDGTRKYKRSTDLCATVGAAKPKGKPGSVVVVVFECTAIHWPLFSGGAAVDLAVENGTVESATPNSFLRPDGAVGGRFLLGALGPDKKGKAQIARLAVAVRLGDPAVSRQTRCRFTFVDLTGGDPDLQVIEFRQPERVVEMEILPPS